MQIKYRSQLVELLRHLALPLKAVEIGTAEANFSRDLLKLGLELLYSVDNWATIEGQLGDGGFEQKWHDKNYEDAMKKLHPFGEKSIILKGLSAEMSKQVPDNSLGLVYLDCDHSYKGVMSDLIHWSGKVVDGGIIASHDYLNISYGVKAAFEEFCRDKYEIHLIPENQECDAGCYFIKTN